ncbi:MAG: putative hydrolase [Tepidanaerobacteraceae bacterium]|nr:putative hydrolase [Tepidanaerobacteraceae bacterium]
MKLWADFHTHTKYSHGTGTIRQNVEVAAKKGLSVIGISEHGPANIGVGTAPDDFERMREEVEILKSNFAGIRILLGCEANIISLDGDLDVSDKILSKLDYVMVGLHPLVWARSLKNAYYLMIENMLQWRIQWLRTKVTDRNTKALIRAVKNHKIAIVTHPGLHLPVDTAALAQIAAQCGTALEINAGHGYMTEEYVRIAKKYGVKFAIGSDAHKPSDVGNFKRGLEIAEKAGLTEDDIINATRVPEMTIINLSNIDLHS